jgi:hypothetical protein
MVPPKRLLTSNGLHGVIYNHSCENLKSYTHMVLVSEMFPDYQIHNSKLICIAYENGY